MLAKGSVVTLSKAKGLRILRKSQLDNLQDTFLEKNVVYLSSGKNGWYLTQSPDIQGAIVAIEPKTGKVKAIKGGYKSLDKFNRAFQTKRQIGSVVKPFIFAYALENGYNLSSKVNDSPVVIADNGENEYWRPKNSNEKFMGVISFREALRKSRNLVSVRLVQDLGVRNIKQKLVSWGFSDSSQPNSISIALGSGFATPFDLTAAYATFPNDGQRVYPYLIDKISTDYDLPELKEKIHLTPELFPHGSLISNNTAFLIDTSFKRYHQ